MQRVTGIGGIFFKAQNPEALREWYRTHLGIDVQDWGGHKFEWGGSQDGATVWCVFESDTEYFAPSHAPFMINYRVANLAQVLDALRAEGCTVDDSMQELEYGKFGWVMDPEGNRIELWEPPAEAPG